MKTLEIRENSKKNYGGIPTKLIISQLPISLDYQTWHQTDTKIQSFYPVVQHANHLPLISMTIDKNIRYYRKTAEKIKGVSLQNNSYHNC